MDALKAYALAKSNSNKYTDESILGITGVLAGKNCTIKSSIHENGVTTIIFQWTADTGETRETQIEIYDGTPIYVYEPGTLYKYGDMVIYEAQWYRCTSEHVAGSVLDPTKFEEIGSPDGSYDIVATSADLPTRFTPADRKMYYSIEDNSFWLWNGTEWEIQTKSITNDEIDALFV